MGAGELGAILGVVCAILLGLLSWQGRREVEKVERIEARVAALETHVAVLDASGVAERVRSLETNLAEIKSDIRHILDLLEKSKK